MDKLRNFRTRDMRHESRLDYNNRLIDAEIEFVGTLSYEERELLIKELLIKPRGVI